MTDYYKILVASQRYHGTDALTYSAGSGVPLRSLVQVPLQQQLVSGLVIETVAKPTFATKAITKVYDLPPVAAALPASATWLSGYYPAPLGSIMQQIMPGNLNASYIATTEAVHAAPLPAAKLPKLSADQKRVLAALRAAGADTILLHGDTGTGKTRIYIEAALAAFKDGASSIILTPEIGLTSQLADNFRRVFGDRVLVLHSQLTVKARQHIWLQILKTTEPLIIIGPRSALFAPVAKLGLIVVDEAHETSYKQDQAPHYHAIRVASFLARSHGAQLILGSATPPITDYYIAEQKQKPILRMTQLAAAIDSPALKPYLQLIDLKNRDAFSRSAHFSTALIQSVERSLAAGEQSLLYLNRRGTARVILCNACGWQAACPHCDLPLTYHHDSHRLICHTCGFHQAALTSCPQCGNADIVFKAIGTKAIYEEAARLFPQARIMRFDTDNTKAERFEQHYEAVRKGQVDILIGTQLLAKGLDLPRLSTLGIVLADTSLSFPDFSAQERTYQLLTQVIGRVGRGHAKQSAEHIILQTYNPDQPVIQAALTGDWDSFYAAELAERKLFFFPPFCYLLKLTCRRASSKRAEQACGQFANQLSNRHMPIRIEGPAPSFHAKTGDKFAWQLVIKSTQRATLLEVVKSLPKSGWSYDIDPVDLL